MQPPAETRSFAPPEETTPMKFTKVSETKPSLRSLARGQNAMHDCLHAHIKTVAEQHDETTAATGNLAQRQSTIADDVRDLKADMAAVKTAFQIDTTGRSRSVAAQRPWVARVQQAFAVAGGIVGVLALARFLAAAWPGLWHVILTTP